MNPARKTIGIVDYSMGNLRSVERALETMGVSCRRVRFPEDMEGTDGLVLPGVGAFGQAVQNLKTQELWAALQSAIQQGKPLLGLCLGLQLLFESSEEFGDHQGLGVFAGKVKRLPAGVLVPHIGWNQVFPISGNPLFMGIPSGSHFYFLHSFVAEDVDPAIIVAHCDYGISFPAVVQRGRTMAAQFHPEKSQLYGLRFFSNFVRMVEDPPLRVTPI